jgi:hypothetical protein
MLLIETERERMIERDGGSPRPLDQPAHLVPWPQADSSVDSVLCLRTLEVAEDVVAVMHEIHRVTRPGGSVEIVGRHFSNALSAGAVPHQRFLGYRTLNYFCDNAESLYGYYSRARFRLVARRLLRSGWDGAPHQPSLLEHLINGQPRAYEHFLAFLVPCGDVYFKLEVLK